MLVVVADFVDREQRRSGSPFDLGLICSPVHLCACVLLMCVCVCVCVCVRLVLQIAMRMTRKAVKPGSSVGRTTVSNFTQTWRRLGCLKLQIAVKVCAVQCTLVEDFIKMHLASVTCLK